MLYGISGKAREQYVSCVRHYYIIIQKGVLGFQGFTQLVSRRPKKKGRNLLLNAVMVVSNQPYEVSSVEKSNIIHYE